MSFKVQDIPDIDASENYWIYNYLKKKVQLVKKNENYEEDIQSNGFGWYIILPEADKCSCFGLINKYVSFNAVENIVDNENSQIIVLHETGAAGWAAKKAAKKVTVNGVDVTKDVKQDGDFYTVNVPEKNTKEVLILEW